MGEGDERRRRIDSLYAEWSGTDQQIEADLDRSLGPRGPDMLFDVVGDLGIGPAHRVLDAGCRDARHVVELRRRFGCEVVGVDLTWPNIVRAAERIGGVDGASVVQGGVEQLPFADSSFDLVWCRDVLIHVGDLVATFSEFGRVLRPGGHALVFQMFATPWLEPNEAARLWPPIAAVPTSTDVAHFETAIARAGLVVVRSDELRSEWREWVEENDGHKASTQLLHAARLIRDRERFVELVGDNDYEAELANCLWGVYQMIGKLSPRIYVLGPRD